MAMTPAVLTDSLEYYLTGDVPITRPTAWTVSLHSGPPGGDGSADEITDAGYARLSATFAVDTSVPTAPFAANDTLLAFGVVDASYTVTHVVVWGDTTPLVVQALRTPRVLAIGEQAQFAIGELNVGGIS